MSAADAKPTPPVGALERLMFQPIPLWTLLLVVLGGLVGLVAYGYLMLDPIDHGAMGRIAVAVATVPDTLERLTESAAPLAPRKGGATGPATSAVSGFQRDAAEAFRDPGHALVTVVDPARNRRVVQLISLADGRVVHTYVPDVDAMNSRSGFVSAIVDLKRDQSPSRYFPMHPLLMSNGDLVVHDEGPLTRIDPCGRIVWMIDGIFHHSVEEDADGNIWAAFRFPRAVEPRVGPKFADEAIVEVSPDGRLLRKERVADILDRNGLGFLWRSRPYIDDPFHLNDIQPVLADGPYWKRGDLFLSLRNLSSIMLYRPSTGRIVWRKNQPWRFQHDVSVVDDHRISVFDNHWKIDYAQEERGEVDGTNRVLIYDFATDQVSQPFARSIAALNVQTRAQGRATPLAGGDFMIEETEQGRLMRLSPDGAVRWRFLSTDRSGHLLQLRWSRYLEAGAYQDALRTLGSTKCD